MGRRYWRQRQASYLDGRELVMESATDKFLLSAVNFAAELEREKARQRTYDAMLRKAKAGHVTGGGCFGYRNVEVNTPGPDGRQHRQFVRRKVEPDEAAIVRRIFELCAAGDGLRCPAISTVHAVLDRHGLVQRRGRRRRRVTGTPLSQASTPNALWCADFKGEFRLGNRQYCYPLTITDFASRYLLTCEALSTTRETYAFAVFERTFKEFGLPRAIRTDNGVPFASAHALYGLSKLSVWWLRLGVGIERIRPGHPEQNGRHERMHLTLKQQATKPAVANLLQQQARFDAFVEQYNHERPHQALAMKVPGDLYVPSPRPYRGLSELDYPLHDWASTVTTCGRICFKSRKVNLSQVFAGQQVGVRQVDEHIWLVTFMHYDLGYFDDETCRLEPIENPFGPTVLPMSPE